MRKNYVKNAFSFMATLLLSNIAMAQVGTGFEEALASSNYYVDAVTTTHQLSNNANQPMVEYVFGSNGSAELGFKTKFIATRTSPTGDDALTDGDYVGVVNNGTVTDVDPVPVGSGNYYIIEDPDGTIQIEFDQVDLTGTTNPQLSLKYGIRSTTYEVADGGNDRLFIALKIEGTSNLITILDSDGDGTEGGNNATGNDIDGQLFEDVEQTLNFSLVPYIGEKVTLIIEGESNADSEEFTFDDIQFSEGTRVSPSLDLTKNNLQQAVFYNNPVNDIFTVKSDFNIASIKLYALNGKELLSSSSNSINMSSFSAGLYVARITAEDNQSIAVKIAKF